MNSAWHPGRFSKRLREHFHSQRTALFLKTMQPGDGVSIIDIGGGDGAFLERLAQYVIKGRFAVADIGDEHVRTILSKGFEFHTVPEGRLPFADREFDIVLCNSVIEHVTFRHCVTSTPINIEWIAQSWELQKRFAGEIQRIGRRYFVQTPHRHFPIEAHTWLPLVNLLGHRRTTKLVETINPYWVKRCGQADWQLLSAEEMKFLFPGGQIHVERLGGLPKSIIAYR